MGARILNILFQRNVRAVFLRNGNE